MSVLAIAARSFNTPAETFIRDHARTIAPGQTVLLCQDGSGAERLDCPVLTGIQWDLTFTPIHQRVVNAVRRRWRRYVDPGMSAADRRRVLAFFEEHQPRAVLAQFGPTGCLFMKTCEMANVPLYVHFHGYDASRLVPRWRRHYKSLFQKAAGVITPSQFLADKVAEIGCPTTKLHVNPIGIDPQRFTATRRLPYRIIAVGRLVEKKAPHLTIEAFANIADQYPEARLDVIGDGPLAERCQALIRERRLGDRICLHGAQSSEFVAQRMRESSLFVQHSVTAPDGDTESFGISLLEAMACEVPIVATRHNGFVDTVDDGVTGLLVNEHDVVGMAAAMAAVLDNPDCAAAMGAAGRRRVLKKFTLDLARDRLRPILGFAPLSESQPAVQQP